MRRCVPHQRLTIPTLTHHSTAILRNCRNCTPLATRTLELVLSLADTRPADAVAAKPARWLPADLVLHLVHGAVVRSASAAGALNASAQRGSKPVIPHLEVTQLAVVDNLLGLSARCQVRSVGCPFIPHTQCHT